MDRKLLLQEVAILAEDGDVALGGNECIREIHTHLTCVVIFQMELMVPRPKHRDFSFQPFSALRLRRGECLPTDGLGS